MASTSTAAERTVLLIEDEKDVRDLVRLNLRKAGFRVLEAGDGAKGLRLAAENAPDVVILDLMLPGIPGEEVCRALKTGAATTAIPVIMLTAKAQPDDRVAGLETGADDYVVKPFSPRELVLRVEAILRRVSAGAAESVLEVGPFALDRSALEVRMDGKKLELTSLEFRLMVKLLENRGRVLTRDVLLRDVWGYRNQANSRTVDTHVRRLRSKLQPHDVLIKTAHGEGYVLSTGEE